MKRLFLGVTLLGVLFCLLAGSIMAQTQTGLVRVVGVPDRYKSANKNQSTTSLKTVGVGQRVVLAPKVWLNQGRKQADTLIPVISATWTLTSPYGAAKSIQDTAAGLNGTYVYFIPDTVGDWTASYTATTKFGSVSGTGTIVVAKFVGEGISLSSNQGVPTGCGCHGVEPTKFSDWSQTNHATAVKRKLNDPTGHFSFSCFSCHSIG